MLGAIAGLPLGGAVIDLFGHMRIGHATKSCAGLPLESVVGLGQSIDPDLDAVLAFERFGVGFIVVGPFGIDHNPQDIVRNDAESEIRVPVSGSKLTVAQARVRLSRRRLSSVKVLLWIGGADSNAIKEQLDVLDDVVDGVIVSAASLADMDFSGSTEKPVFVHVEGNETSLATTCREPDGFYVTPPSEGEAITKGKRHLSSLVDVAVELRAKYPHAALIADGGVMEGRDAKNLIERGYDLLVVDAGMVFGGPGLPKRINETLEAAEQHSDVEPHSSPTRQTWFWTMLMGSSMMLGGILATVIALTRVVLPYDEAMVGMDRLELLAINDRLLDFMKHDRITLAGTMLSVGGLYMACSWFGIRRGQHWASVTVFVSAFLGFASFFLFLGFGYFDPFHAFVTAILFQFLLLAVFSHETNRPRLCYADPVNDSAWQKSLWGQLLFLLQGAALIVAGIVICKVGITSVFVPEDTEFMCTTPEKLFTANPQLVPLVAHDRATFGGMLVSCGVVVLLTTLWGFRRGASWIWWMLLLGGCVAYGMTIWIHHAVGYIDSKHLLPAYGGLLCVFLGSWLTRGYLCDQVSDRV